jgi:hypothetical protein
LGKLKILLTVTVPSEATKARLMGSEGWTRAKREWRMEGVMDAEAWLTGTTEVRVRLYGICDISSPWV